MPSKGSLTALLLLALSPILQAEDKAPTPPAEANTETVAETPAPAPKPIKRPPLPDYNDQRAQELARLLPTQAQTLTAGEDSFPALWLPASDGQPKGAVILLPGTGETPDWPRVISPLRYGLAQQGWHTLSLSLPEEESNIPSRPPEPPKPVAPAADAPKDKEAAASEGDKKEENKEDSAKEAEKPAEESPAPTEEEPAEVDPPRPPLAERISARIEAALTFARAQDAKVIVLLGHGTGGYWAAHYLSQDKAEALQQLILISPSQPTGQEVPLEGLLAKLPLATGDFYYADRPTEQQAANLRRSASQRARHPAYSQTPLNTLAGDLASEQQQLLRRIRGWLDRQLAAGG